MSNKNRAIYIIIGIVLGVFAYSLISSLRPKNTPNVGLMENNQQGYKDKVSLTMDLIDYKYVDRVSRDSLNEALMEELFKQLDPHSDYIPASVFQKLNESLSGEFEGVGIMFNTMTDTALITNVIPGGPSYKAGVAAGDRIMKVDDVLVAGVKMNSDSLVKKMRGPKGTKVTLGLLRNGSEDGSLINIDVIRDVIPIKSLDAAFMIEDTIGYVKFLRFSATSYKEVKDALDSLRTAGAKRFIMDLRDNNGGMLDQAILISDMFLEKGQGIVNIEGLRIPRTEHKATGKGLYQDIPLTIIIDENSASASEIVAGAIQDNDRGLVVGRKSFGKGLVQEQYPYSDGSAIRLTIARYYTPVGRCIQKSYKLGESEEYYMELLRRAQHEELFNVDSIKQNDSLQYVTPGGKIVYGGGGIMPDIFVPMDTTALSPYFKDLFEKNLIFKYATILTESNRREINQIETLQELDAFFAKLDVYADFVAYASKHGVVNANAKADKSRTFIISQIKGYVGRNTVMQDTPYYYYMKEEDATMKRAIEVTKGL